MDKSKQITVSGFKNVNDTDPKDISLLRWLEGYAQLNKLVDAIRGEPDKDKRRELKKWLPAITPCGRFSARRADGLIEHSRYIALDFDDVDPKSAKTTLQRISNVFYAGLSASGRGIWALIPISNPEHHRRHFDALQADFKALRLTVDQACKDVSRLRFYSYDPDPVINLDVVVYSKIAKQKQYKTYRAPNRTGNALENLINKIEAQGHDITDDYMDWIKIAGTLASVYGAGGRELFHRVSRFYPKYDSKETDRQYNTALRNPPGYSEAMIFHIAKKHSILLKDKS